ncbi:MAG: HAMP domain-containing sensor histidine kinase [Syntrophomonadaceae bacterium]|nr:HAMP domain-containing sensor histidine kinase [Syntrophomonadaceae bacterium]
MIRIKSITGKILISYLVVVICSTAITALSFRSIMYRDIENRVKRDLTRQAVEIAMFLKREKTSLVMPQEIERPLRRPMSFFFAGRLDSEYVVADSQGIILFSSLPEQFPAGRRLEELPAKLYTETSENGEINICRRGPFLTVQVPIGAAGEASGSVFAFAQVSELEALNKDILFILFKSLLVAIVIAVPIALLFARYLIKPLNALREYARAVAKRRFDLRLEIKSDDELAELASTFNDMAAQLERYDISIRRFFQGASHELKTPLMSIQGYAEGIRDGVFNGDQLNRALDIIAKECQRLKSIVDEMIHLTRSQGPGETYSFLPQDLKTILDEVVESLGGYALEKQVAVDVLGDSIKIIGDREKLRRLFGNLLANAVRHAKKRVTVRTQLTDSNRNLKISIQDDGEGFSAQDLEHAFDYFYKGPNGSTGLGLAIARLIAEEHGGTIAVSNAPEGGAVVEVTFPV